MKFSRIMGTITVVGIIGGTIYAIKKYKDLEKSEKEEITLAEAKEIVAEREAVSNFDNTNHEDKELTEEEMEILKDGVREMASWNRSFMPDYDEEDSENIEGPSIGEDEEIDDNIGKFTEEDRKLRFEPNTIDALKQFKRMELAELEYNPEVYQTMLRLFDFPFEPQNDGDELLGTQIIDYRVQFFGFSSKWVKQVTFADIILHYARNAQFNCDESLAYWVEYFLECADLYYQYSSSSIDVTIKDLNAHKYFNHEKQTFGLFGLTRSSMDQAIRTASMNIDNSVTYEIEFQEFLKSIL